MIQINIVRSSDLTTISAKGHAGYDVSGKDIVCAAASVLFINTINSIESFTSATIDISQTKEDISVTIKKMDEKAKVLLDSMILGFNEIEKQYSDKYISFHLEEV